MHLYYYWFQTHTYLIIETWAYCNEKAFYLFVKQKFKKECTFDAFSECELKLVSVWF